MVRSARIVALDLVARAEIQAVEGSIVQACATWGRAIDDRDGVAPRTSTIGHCQQRMR
ncbi:hypothetical protein [Streptomyces sp. NPDC053720]|uniref:hypothetical protein n=1 Tax=Streptomyces sp. NPDC053720 TaxID=3154855 RepID=UPI003439112C